MVYAVHMVDQGTIERQIGFIGRLVGLDIIEQLINRRFDRIEQILATNATDQAALEATRDILRVADATVDSIESTPRPKKK